jgi:hypothetical protein
MLRALNVPKDIKYDVVSRRIGERLDAAVITFTGRALQIYRIKRDVPTS